MPQDAFTIKTATAELNALLTGGRINKINQPNDHEIILNVYTAGKNVDIAVSADAQTARICPTKNGKVNPAVAPNFCMLLRKHLSGATIHSVTQPENERIIVITLQTKNDFFEMTEKRLICEIMGKYSNVFLTENGKILGSLRPAFLDLGSVRNLFTGAEYTLPPAQDKAMISQKTRVLGDLSAFGGGNAEAFIAANIKGIALSTAREAITQFFGNESVPAGFGGKAEEFYDFLYDFLENPKIYPNVTDKDFYVNNYLSVPDEKRHFPTLLEAEAAFFDGFERNKEYRKRYKALHDKISAHDKKLKKKLQILTEKELSCADAETNRIKGEILTAFQYSVRPGANSCELDNYYSETGEKIKIALDPTLSANGNAQAYYKKYNKQKKTLAAVIPQKNEVLSALDYTEDLLSELDRCETAADFDLLTEELISAGIVRAQKSEKSKKEKPSCPKTFVLGDFFIRVGRNNVQNDRLTASSARDDIWLHTKDFHSSHVIIETEGRSVPDEILCAAAEICAYNSKARMGDKVPVDYCYKKYVKKPPNSKPGGVIYTNFKTVYVTPNPHTELEKV